jgi:hypothetical protein
MSMVSLQSTLEIDYLYRLDLLKGGSYGKIGGVGIQSIRGSFDRICIDLRASLQSL